MYQRTPTLDGLGRSSSCHPPDIHPEELIFPDEAQTPHRHSGPPSNATVDVTKAYMRGLFSVQWDAADKIPLNAPAEIRMYKSTATASTKEQPILEKRSNRKISRKRRKKIDER